MRLEQLVTAQEQFVADASHQLRTPLTALRLRLEMLEDEDDRRGVGGPRRRPHEVQRLSRLVDGLLALARAERATGRRPAAAIAWAGRAGGARQRLAPGGRRARRDARDRRRRHRGRATPDHLGQALDNLLANALEVAPAGSTIRLWVAPGAGRRPSRST